MSQNKNSIILPLMPLRGLVILPNMTVPFDVGRKKSIKVVEEAMASDQHVIVVTQKNNSQDYPEPKDLYKVGTIVKIKQTLKVSKDVIRVLVEGISRVEISEVIDGKNFYYAEAVKKNTRKSNTASVEAEALRRNVTEAFEEYVRLSGKIPQEVMASLFEFTSLEEFADIIASFLIVDVKTKQMLLSEFNVIKRLDKILAVLVKENKILEVETDIKEKVNQEMEKNQKEYYLREQIKVIKKELGEEDILSEIEEYREKFKKRNLPKHVEEKVEKELKKLEKVSSSSPERGVIRTYIDWILDIPWDKSTKEVIDLEKAKKILDRDHFGMENVKERIIEYLAVRKLKNNLKGPIICLVGPPGVGKTSIAKSVAKALNRNYVRIALGGVRDEAEIRGHRRTYVGAIPGRIVYALKQAKSNNPLILFDEIDKMGNDFRGDPASAMLEVLDSEQNNTFRDHFIELDFDLSNVLFITTANTIDTIPSALLDRMEVINLSSYTEYEKVNIAFKHLLKKQVKENGLKTSNIKIEENAMSDIVNYYTREAGVRTLERTLSKICRKVATQVAGGNVKKVTITSDNLVNYLGKKKFNYEPALEKDEVGVARGLAWTSVGGDTLNIEVAIIPGKGKIQLTGKLGEVMKESAMTALSYVRSIGDLYNIDKSFFDKNDLHIHVPEGAVPKDGPSAGITMATAITSAITGIAVKKSVAMTGEITLRGKVMAIGGLKEKSLAAYRCGIKTIIIPKENEKDIDEIPLEIRENMTFIPVTEMKQVLEEALVRKENESYNYMNVIKDQVNVESESLNQ